MYIPISCWMVSGTTALEPMDFDAKGTSQKEKNDSIADRDPVLCFAAVDVSEDTPMVVVVDGEKSSSWHLEIINRSASCKNPMSWRKQ